MGRDLYQALSSLPALYSSINAPDILPDALDGIVKSVGVVSATMFTYNHVGFNFDTQTASRLFRGHEDEFVRFFERFGHYEMQSTAVLARQPLGVPLFDLEVWPDEPDYWSRDDIKYLRENWNIYRRFGFRLSDNPAWSAGIHFQVAASHQIVPDQAVQTAGILSPHLSKVAELRRFVSQLQNKYRVVLGALDRVSVGMSVFGQRGDLMLHNAKMQDLIDQKDGVSKLGSEVVLLDAEANHNLKEAVRRCSNTLLGQDNKEEFIVSVPRPSGKMPISVIVSPLMDGGEELGRGIVGALAIFIDTADPPKSDLSVLVEAHGLSAAEAQVSKLVLEGAIDREISERRDVSVQTVRSQIKSILAKCGCNNRTQFVRRAFETSPPID